MGIINIDRKDPRGVYNHRWRQENLFTTQHESEGKISKGSTDESEKQAKSDVSMKIL